MKSFFLIVVPAALIIGCSENQAPNNNIRAQISEQKTAATSEYYLDLMNQDLDAVEKGDFPEGSFTDFFLTNATKAFEAGATREEISSRIDRLIVLAKGGKHLSLYVEELFRDGGEEAIRSFVNENIFGS